MASSPPASHRQRIGASEVDMPLIETTLGDVLPRIYEFDLGATLYLPKVDRYEPGTPCVIAVSTTRNEAEEQALHLECLGRGFANCLNLAVVSDTCDDVVTRTIEGYVTAFNQDCQEGRWLARMMNYRVPAQTAQDN